MEGLRAMDSSPVALGAENAVGAHPIAMLTSTAVSIRQTNPAADDMSDGTRRSDQGGCIAARG